MGSDMPHQLRSHMGSDMPHQLHSHMGSGMPHQLSSHMGSGMPHQFHSHMGSGMPHQFHSHMGSDMPHQLRSHMGSDMPHLTKQGVQMASVEREPITWVWGQSPQRGPGAESLVRESGGKPGADPGFQNGGGTGRVPKARVSRGRRRRGDGVWGSGIPLPNGGGVWVGGYRIF